jgi:hypothetical protein
VTQLPDEVLNLIFSYISHVGDSIRFALSCKHLLRIGHSLCDEQLSKATSPWVGARIACIRDYGPYYEGSHSIPEIDAHIHGDYLPVNETAGDENENLRIAVEEHASPHHHDNLAELALLHQHVAAQRGRTLTYTRYGDETAEDPRLGSLESSL